MHQKFQDRAQFVLIYLREAHPKGGWEMSDWSVLTDPTDIAGRIGVAAHCSKELKFDFPIVVDTMDDDTAVRWSGWPERLFVLSKEGKVAYTGDMGPFGFHPSVAYAGFNGRKAGLCMEEFLDAYLGAPAGKAVAPAGSE